MPQIAVTHAPSGLVHAFVVRRERVTPHMVRVTLGGPDLDRFAFKGFDQWVRLALPVHDGTRYDNLSQRFGMGGYLKFLTLPKATRPVIRNYTIRDWRAGDGNGGGAEVDIDFVCHGSEGVAGPWAEAVEPGVEVAFIDQGCGWKPEPADTLLIVSDESGLPAVVGILRDLPRDAVGHAVIEVIDEADIQPVDGPDGVVVQWLVRPEGVPAGETALAALTALTWTGSVYAFAIGESKLATGARKHLVGERGVPKSHVTFSGYWKQGKAAPGGSAAG